MTPAQVDSFRTVGFLRLGAIVSGSELELVRALCDRGLEEFRSRTMRFVSLAGEIPDSLVTVVSPEAAAPQLNYTPVAGFARTAAAALYGCEPDEMLLGWRIFFKLPGAEGTPWHQDAAYRPPPHLGVSMFLPLDAMDSEASCIRYIPGSHLGGLYPHVFEHGHYAAQAPECTAAVLCPLEAGEATMHHCLTLHATGPHCGARPRRAMAIVFQPPARD